VRYPFEEFPRDFPALARSMGLNPLEPNAYEIVGRDLLNRAKPHVATAVLRKAVELRPRSAQARRSLAHALARLGGCHEQALVEFRRAVRLNPHCPRTAVDLAHYLFLCGGRDEACQRCEEIIEDHPNLAPAYCLLDSIRGWTPRELGWAESLVGRRSVVGSDKVRLLFALAQAYDRRGAHDQAFQYCRRANRMQKAIHGDRFCPRAHQAYIDLTVRCFPADLFQAKRTLGIRSDMPILIVGMPRSGTTLVEQILCSHPSVLGGGELRWVGNAAAALPSLLGTGRPYPLCASLLSKTVASRLAHGYLRYLRGSGKTASRVTDKMPGNYLYLGFVALLLPGTKVIHCTRDPRDACLSCYFTDFLEPAMAFTCNLDHLVAYYKAYARLMRHWRQSLVLPILDVRYEQLVAEPEPTIRELLGFCNLEWNDACLRFPENRRPVLTASASQVRRSIYVSSVGRWKHYEHHVKQTFEGVHLDSGHDC